MNTIERLAILETEIKQLRGQIRSLRQTLYVVFGGLVANLGVSIS